MELTGDDYQEVYEILSHMNKLEVMKIPEEILYTIKERRNKDYKTKIDLNNLFNMENISENAQIMLAWLDYSFFMDERKKEELKREAYEEYNNNYKDFFENEKGIKYENNAISIIEKEKWYTKFLDNITKVFNRKK